jgi:hypothetical protein
MSDEPRAVPPQEIAAWLRTGATVQRDDIRRESSPGITTHSHLRRVQASLHRARTKTFVRLVKPLRGLFRNQGAVNLALIEAVHHLSGQTEEMMAEIRDLRAEVSQLRRQVRALLHCAASSSPAPESAERDS